MKGIFTVVIFYYIKAIVAQDSCQQFPIPDHVYFDESSSTGSTIFISNKTNTTQQEWIVTTDLSRKINLTFSNQTYYIKLLTAIDLDVSDPIQTCDSALETFVERISCVGTDGQPVDKIVTFHLQPVNEYPPDVNTVPDINISEGNFSLPLYLYRLFDYFKDRDCPKERLMLSISDYSSKEKDVGGYFMVNNSTGYLYQVRHFDYEDTDIQCGLGKGGGFVNIRAEDGLHKTSKSLSVTFINIDDAPPVVVNSVCSTVCFTCPISSLSAFVHITHQGPIITDPPGVKAIDLDTKQSNIIVYTLDVYPTKYKDIIWFEDSRFVLLQSFANFSKYKEESDFTVIVTMQQEYRAGTGHHLTALQRYPVLTFLFLIMFTLTKRHLMVDKDVTFHVRPVNEHPPHVGVLPGIQISEVAHDASYFFMINSTYGFLYQSKIFDNEDITFIQCDQWKEGGFLNITADDGVHKTSKSLRVTFVDVDDHPPLFVMSGCTTICYTCPRPYLDALVDYFRQGPIITYPHYIKALDPDTSTTNFTYNMEVYPRKYKDNIRFINGSFYLLQPLSNFTDFREHADFEITVVLQATGSNGQTGNCTLLMSVVDTPSTISQTTTTSNILITKVQKRTSSLTKSRYAPSNTTSDSTIKQPHSSQTTSDSMKDIIIIVLAVVVGLLISACIIHTVHRIRNQKTKSDDKIPSYEEVKRNNDTKENEYATIQN